jgi:hypothetical protein
MDLPAGGAEPVNVESDMQQSTLGLRLAAAAALVVEIVVHAELAPDHLAEMPYIGASFVAASVLLTANLVALFVLPRDRRPWLAGAAMCAGMCALFVVSRTVGLPGYHESWTSDNGIGLVCIPPEVLFVACALRAVPAAQLRRAL